MKLHELVDASRAVAQTRARREKIDRLAALIRRLGPDETDIGVSYLCGELRQGRIGLGAAALRDAAPGRSAGTPALELADVDRVFERIAAITGRGSAAERKRLLRELMSRATATEQAFLVRLIFGELRQGALEGIMADAVARAADVPADHVRRALMLAGDLRAVASAAAVRGEAGLAEFSLKLFAPVKPMLAQPAESVAEALGDGVEAAFEYKLDGARVQAHKSGDQVAIFTRRLNDVTGALPEIVEAVRSLPAEQIVLDGEVLGLADGGRPVPFQATMRRFGRKLDVEALRRELPVAPFFFDCLYLDGAILIDHPAGHRFGLLAERVRQAMRVPRIVTADAARAEAFLAESLAAGHEGVMAKTLGSAYQAGARGASWLKVKPAHTLDLVVLAAEWGHGRRRGWLSNLHLGARDPATGGFVMLGKTFKGMTDEILAWQTQRLQELEISRDAHTVYVRPQLVAEIAFGDVQASPQYPGGMALRFARLKRYRPDKRADDADTIDAVREIHQRSG